MFLVYVNEDANSPYEINGVDVLKNFLSTIKPNTPILIEEYDVILRNRSAYNMTGGTPTPTLEDKEKFSLKNSTRIHIEKE